MSSTVPVLNAEGFVFSIYEPICSRSLNKVASFQAFAIAATLKTWQSQPRHLQQMVEVIKAIQ